MIKLLNVKDIPMRYDSLKSFVIHVHYVAQNQDLEHLHEFLDQYVCDDNGVYPKVH